MHGQAERRCDFGASPVKARFTGERGRHPRTFRSLCTDIRTATPHAHTQSLQSLISKITPRQERSTENSPRAWAGNVPWKTPLSPINQSMPASERNKRRASPWDQPTYPTAHIDEKVCTNDQTKTAHDAPNHNQTRRRKTFFFAHLSYQIERER
jgi:hypothetical protein